MKKLLLGSIALVMIVLALAGCGKTTSSSSATTKESVSYTHLDVYKRQIITNLYNIYKDTI